MKTSRLRSVWRPAQALPVLLAAAALAGCAPMPTGGSSTLPSISNMFSQGLSLSPSVNVAKNMKGRPVADAITALGEPSTKRAVGNTMELVWSDYQTAPYTEWVSTGSSQQVVGMIPATATTAATPVFQQSNSGYYGNRTKVYECKVVMRCRTASSSTARWTAMSAPSSSMPCASGPASARPAIIGSSRAG